MLFGLEIHSQPQNHKRWNVNVITILFSNITLNTTDQNVWIQNNSTNARYLLKIAHYKQTWLHDYILVKIRKTKHYNIVAKIINADEEEALENRERQSSSGSCWNNFNWTLVIVWRNNTRGSDWNI